MAVTRGTVGVNQSTSVVATEEKFYDRELGDTPCSGMLVRNLNSANHCIIRVEGMHNGVPVGSGTKLLLTSEQVFRQGEGHNGIIRMYVTGNVTVANIDWGPVEAG